MNHGEDEKRRRLETDLADALAARLPATTRDRIERVLARRTRHLTLVTEDLYQARNAAAVIRACDAFGIQDIHTVCDRNKFQVGDDELAAEAAAWISIHTYRRDSGHDITTCIDGLKQRGYKIAAATLRDGAVPVNRLSLDCKLALVFGTEEHGLSERAHEAADIFFRLPMYGFTQSFNISVSAALSLFQLEARLRQSDLDWGLTEEETLHLKLTWLTRMVSDAEAVWNRLAAAAGMPDDFCLSRWLAERPRPFSEGPEVR